MRNGHRFLLASLSAFLLLGISHAQSAPGVPLSGVSRFAEGFNELRDGIFHTETFSVCNAGTGTWHNVTYTYTFGNKGTVPYMDVDSGQPCACAAGEPGPVDDCHIVGNDGQQTSYDNSAAPVSYTLSNTASPLNRPLSNKSLSIQPAPRTAGATAFAYTLPYRALPAGYVSTASLPSISPICNSQINPTLFEVAHMRGTVTLYDLCTKSALAVVNVPPLPLQVRVTPDGSQAVVTSYQNAITFIDTGTNQISKTIQTDPSFTPSGIAISPDGTFALVTNFEQTPNAYLAVVNLASKQVTSTIALDTGYPQSVFITPDSSLAWVTFPFDDLVEVIDLLTGVSVASLNADTPYSVAFNPTGTVAYVAGGAGSGSVEVYNTTTYALSNTISGGAGAGDLLVSPDEVFFSINNAFGSSVVGIDAVTLTPTLAPLIGSPRGAVRVPVQ